MRAKHIDICLNFLDEEVKNQKGLSGLAIRNAYKALCAFSPDAPRRVIDHLFDDFWAAYERIGGEPKALSEAWIEITDQKAQATKHKSLAKAYQSLKTMAKKRVEEAIPKLLQALKQSQMSLLAFCVSKILEKALLPG